MSPRSLENSRAVLLGQAGFCILLPHHPGVLVKHLKAEHSLGPEGLLLAHCSLSVFKQKGKVGRGAGKFTSLVLSFSERKLTRTKGALIDSQFPRALVRFLVNAPHDVNHTRILFLSRRVAA